MRSLRVFLALVVAVLSGPAQVLGAGVAVRGGAPALPSFGRLTGATGRSAADPGPVRKMWFVFSTQEQRWGAVDHIKRLQAANPGLEVVFKNAESVLAKVKDEAGEEHLDKQALHAALRAESVEFVLAADQSLYEPFRSLRDADLARDIPFGFAGRRYISVDIPRASLDPAALSDPRTYPHEKFLQITRRTGARMVEIAGMIGVRAGLSEVLKEAAAAGHGAPKKDEDMGLVARAGMNALVVLSGQGDDRATAKARAKAHKLAAYIESEAIDVLAIDDAESARVVALMKEMGYHKSLPVVWEGRGDPGDASGINLALHRGAWMDAARHVAAAQPSRSGRGASINDAFSQAVRLQRLPDNFMEMGGVTIDSPEPVVAEAVFRAAPDRPKAGKRYDVHLLLTNGNGVWKKGDANAFGHFGMAVTDEKGKIQVWTVQYNDGGSFTGGLGDGKQMTLAEYLYASLWYLPGAVGQAIPLAETAVSPVVDFILKGAVDEAGLEAMRRVAADINARHLKGEDNYSFLNKDGNTNCISLVTQILRAAGFHIAENGVQAPADKAVEMIAGLARRLLTNQVGPRDFGMIVFERPKHAGPEHYRIANTALGSPFFNRKRTWKYMTLRQKVWRILTWIPALIQSFRIPQTIDSFAAMANVRVVVGPNSRNAELTENPDSPIVKLRAAAVTLERLRKTRAPVEEELLKLNAKLAAASGHGDWRNHPDEKATARDPRRQARLDKLRRRQHDLSLRLALMIVDEQIAMHTLAYQRLRVADPLARHERRLAKVRAAHQQVLEYRDRMEVEDRVLDAAEIVELNELNSKVHYDLLEIHADILREIGPVVPQDMTMISRQVTLDTLDELLKKGKHGDGVKGKDKAKESKGS